MYNFNQMPVVNNLAKMSSYESCDFSDTDSVVDSIIDHLKSPNHSMDNSWSPLSNDSMSDQQDQVDFSDIIFKGFMASDPIEYNRCNDYEACPSTFPSNIPNLVNYPTEPNRSLNVPVSVFPPQSINNAIFNNDFTDLDSYLGTTTGSNPLNNVDDLRNLSVDELIQNNMEFGIPHCFPQQQLNLPISQLSINNQNDVDIFSLNKSTIDNRRQAQEHFLQIIKQQQQQQQDSNSLFNSSPPPTPTSDWSDIPSPVSTTGSDYDLPKHQITNKKSDNKKAVIQQTRKRTSRKPYSTNTGKPRLFQFLQDILNDPENYPCIEWVDKASGTFKFLNSTEVARLWGFRKNKPAMKYEHFARSLRTYVAKGILKKPRSKLVYGFAFPESE